MNGERADMIFTDPPYGLNKKIKNDGKRGIMDLHRKWIPISFEHLKDFSSWYFWNADEILMRAYVEIVMPLMSTYNLHFKNLIVWNKGVSPGMGADTNRMYAPGHECCLFLTRGNDEYPVDAGTFYEGFEEIRKYLSDNIKKLGGENCERGNEKPDGLALYEPFAVARPV